MKIAFIYRIIPVPIFYTKWCVELVGSSCNFFILIDPFYKNDTAVEKHELIHVKQFWRTFWLHPILYKFSREYRLKSEIEAYGAQIKFDRINTLGKAMWIVRTLYNDYGLNMRLAYIQGEVNKKMSSSFALHFSNSSEYSSTPGITTL